MPHNPSSAPMSKPLNSRQQRFVQEYLTDGNASAAARRAGYGGRGNTQGCMLMKSPRVRAAIAAAQALQAAPMTREAAIAALREIAEANVLDYARPGPDGALELDLWRLERDRAGAVKALSVVEQTNPKTGVVTRTVRFELADRAAALARLLPMLSSTTERDARLAAWLKGAESMMEMTAEEFGRFRALWEARTGDGKRGERKREPFNLLLDDFWDGESDRRMTEAQARISETLAAREAEIDAWSATLGQEQEALAEEQQRLDEQARRLARREAEAALRAGERAGA